MIVLLESAYILEVLTLSNICSYRCTVGLCGKKQQRGGYVYQSSKVRYLVARSQVRCGHDVNN